MSVVAEVQ